VSDLETLLRAAAKSGRLNYISVGFTKGVWSASYRGVEDREGRMFDSKDVVVALTGALGKADKRPTSPTASEDLL
jgi:hypothetical protein